MKSNTFTIVRFIVALLTVLAIAGQPYIPPKKLIIHPSAKTYPSTYGPTDPVGGRADTWIDRVNNEWRCNYKKEFGVNNCGFTLSWHNGDLNGATGAETSQIPICVNASSDDDNDGWGWENEQSCIVIEPDPASTPQTTIKQTSQPTCSPETKDEDGDGFGWENDQPCILLTPEALTQSRTDDKIPVCTSTDADDDGDGWGWENGQSCIVESTTLAMPAPESPSANIASNTTSERLSETAPINITPECDSAASDDDGDGWGWENEQSCMVTENSKQPANGQVSETDETLADQSAVDNDSPPTMPTCISADSDDDGDGWGWENEQSCIVRSDNNSKPSVARKRPYCTEQAADDAADGWADGWGWENGQSCVFENSAADTDQRAVEENATAPMVNRGIDFSEYDGLNVRIHYEGRAQHIRVHLRNYNTQYSREDDDESTKFMSAYLRTEDLKAGEAYIDLSEFSVAEWWILNADAPRELAAPELSNVVSISIDHMEHGIHRMRTEHIELVGERISKESFLMAVVAFWAVFLFAEALTRYYYLYRAARHREAQIDLLTSEAKHLEEERSALQTLSVTDALTGIFNRAGFSEAADTLYNEGQAAAQCGLLLFDIDHFKNINDTHGHDIGDHILKSFTRIIAMNIRHDEIFARWGGEEFVLLCATPVKEKLIGQAEKLRQVISNYNFEPQLGLKITVSLGITTIKPGECFDETFKRADIALYKAKENRNSVFFQE